jgi:hypothetical protein
MKLVQKLSIPLIAILLGSACSSGSSKASPPPTTAALTKAAYIVKANAICQTMNNRVKALGDPGRDPKKVAAVIDSSTVIIRQTLVRLRALPVPSGEATKLDAVYATVDKVLADAPSTPPRCAPAMRRRRTSQAARSRPSKRRRMPRPSNTD